MAELNQREYVHHPEHYQSDRIETIDVIEAFKLNFSMGSAVKYLLRCGKKHDPIEDLRKAVWYIEREIERRKEEEIAKENR